MEGIKVLSYFDGMSCGQIALKELGIKVDKYFASEIDKHAIKVTRHNFPDTIQLGDVTKINLSSLPKIDLLIGGSPCQGFSNSGKGLNFEDPRSKLFFEFVRALKELKPKYFLLENVKMKKEWQDIISSYLGVEPIEINSALVSAQNRRRLYWTNIPNVSQPTDRGVIFADIMEHEVDEKYFYSSAGLAWIKRYSDRTGKKLRIYPLEKKMQCLEASMYKKYSAQRFFGVLDSGRLRYITPCECAKAQTIPDWYVWNSGAIRGRRLNKAQILGRRMVNGVRQDYNKDAKITQCLEVRKDNSKSNCLTTVCKDNVLTPLEPGRYPDAFSGNLPFRYLTPQECSKLQTVPDWYQWKISDTQMYKMLGNGWTIEVIKHIFKNIR